MGADSKKTMKARPSLGEEGFITLDFIFAFFLSIGFSLIFFIVAITLSLVEVGQYVTYATSRAYLGAHETQEQQVALAQAKFKELMAQKSIKTFLAQDWMKLGPPELGDFGQDYNTELDNNTFIGARVPLDAKLLHLRIPFLGSTAEESGVGKATLNSYLMREVSTTECREAFNRARLQNIKNLGPYGAVPGSQEKLITDNGC